MLKLYEVRLTVGVARLLHWFKHFWKIGLLLICVVVLGVAGFVFIEGWSVFESLYMTFITISTVGFNEVRPLTTGGRFLVVVLIILGVGTFFYIMTTLSEYAVSGQLEGVLGRRRMKKKIDALDGHYILCGFGRVGVQVAMELSRENMPFVVVDEKPENAANCADLGYLYVAGDATDDDVLRRAGILRARGLVTATDSDADNVYISLSARNLKRDIFIVARSNTEKTEFKLLKAGADRVLSPYSIGGKRLASLLLRPAVVDFLDVVMHARDIELVLEEVLVREGSAFAGITMGKARALCEEGANILAILKKDRAGVFPNPAKDLLVEAGDKLVVVGTKKQLGELEGLLCGTGLNTGKV
ncbi:MAG: potassium channel family protein [Thermodesulfobacteriota bacterium]